VSQESRERTGVEQLLASRRAAGRTVGGRGELRGGRADQGRRGRRAPSGCPAGRRNSCAGWTLRLSRAGGGGDEHSTDPCRMSWLGARRQIRGQPGDEFSSESRGMSWLVAGHRSPGARGQRFTSGLTAARA
jgi:hypothetical protein